MMKTNNSLLVVVVLLLSMPSLYAVTTFDVRFQLEGIDCETNVVCYNVQLRTQDGESWNLAGQNYRIFYDGSEAKYVTQTATSLLPENRYTNALVTSDFHDLDGTAFGDALPFSDHLSFLNYQIDVKNLTVGGIRLPASGDWVTTSNICFEVSQAVIDNADECLNLVWARMGLTDAYATAFVEVNEWVGPNNEVLSIPNVHDDLDENDGNDSCLSGFCPGGGNNTEDNIVTCSDGIDNDQDGLIDCADPGCVNISICNTREYDISLALSNIDCVTGMTCYNVQLTADDSFELGKQTYRLYYDSEVGQLATVVSRLNNRFQPASISSGSSFENQNMTGTGPLVFEDNLGYVEFSIDLVSGANGSDINVSAAPLTVAEMCFNMSSEAISNSGVCFQTAWARSTLTGPYSSSGLEINEWVSPNNQKLAEANTYNDLNADSGDAACFAQSCPPTTEENTLMACSDNMDNDNDGLIDCQDPDCAQFELCDPNCDAKAPSLRGR